jgi:hypothetical protein
MIGIPVLVMVLCKQIASKYKEHHDVDSEKNAEPEIMNCEFLNKNSGHQEKNGSNYYYFKRKKKLHS